MKKTFLACVIVLSVILSACVSAPSKLTAVNPPVKIVSSTPTGEQLVPEVNTTLPDNAFPPSVGVTSLPPAVQSPATIVLDDNGKTFNFHVGDTFLLDLGMDVYDWTVTVDNQDVIALKMGLMAIKGAQGTFDALNPGTATLTAVGDPLCRKSSPPCGMPTILFKVTLIVQ